MIEALLFSLGLAVGALWFRSASADPIKTCWPHRRYGCAQCRFANQAEPETFECKTGGTHLSAEAAKKCRLPGNLGGGP